MTMTDPIADMLTQIRNAGMAKFKSVEIPGSKMKTEIARVLKDEGYIRNYRFVKDGKQGILKIYLKYTQNGKNAILGLKRCSLLSRRVYVKSKDIKPVLNGMGIAIISTSKGLMTDKTARKENVGGELICTIW